MLKLNENHIKLPSNYLFAEIASRVNKFKQDNPSVKDKVIKLGIGDVTRPLVPACIEAMHKAVDEMSNESTFRGYPDYEGCDFLIKDIVDNEYKDRGLDINYDEVFVSDGAKSDTANFQELFSQDVKIAVTDPVYPVYVDSNVMSGRSGDFIDGRWSNIVYLDSTEENGFVPPLPSTKVDIIYLCFPNNPTGSTVTKAQLKKFVDYALENNALIFYDAAYEAYIREEGIPHSIYEIEGARRVAIEFKSFSKNAGFTGVRCAYTIVPKDLEIFNKNTNQKYSLNRLWYRRQATKFNGVSYITQRGAAAIYTKEGKKQIKELIDFYLNNASIIKKAFEESGFKVYGGVNSPYIWIPTPNNKPSWEFFDYMLNNLYIVGTPGVGFGRCGEGFFRFTAFGSLENTQEAARRIKNHKF